ncbi:hypothetical protein SDC9_39951 [bioreactor metagenome]|uniref:Glycerol-1-phosphate dehydrogenase [NAD(P)+] n=1 Tax=bioreactor metagenome TaxID=1076179 RepID=A0A644VQV9_9ZZZZ|nr:sn-glycerol-1-phosphate dehydrogenase [Macellibacteroides fermentans]
MNANIEKALAAANDTRALWIGAGVSDRVADLFKEQFPAMPAVIVADTTTWQVLGEKVSRLFSAAGIVQESPFIFDNDDLYAEYGFVEQLTAALSNHTAIPVAVGSGTINDLTKLSAYQADRRYMCVATAASMDGYTAFGASITADGAKQTFGCPAPQACLADTDIIRKAPPQMTASGYADLFAKVTAGADWILADALQVEAIDKRAWSVVQDGLPGALSDPEGIAAGSEQAIGKLIEGLMLGGFAMQATQSSRPASGAEHQFSHLWNMEHFLNHGEHVSHGFQVSIGTIAVTAFYEQVLQTDLSELDVEKACRLWPDRDESDARALKLFEGTDFPLIGVQETGAKYIPADELREQLQLLKSNWEEIRSRLRTQLLPLSELRRRLERVGAPVEPEQIGLSRSRLREAFIRAQYIRRRYTVLDLAVRTGYLDTWLDQLFGADGIWEIK